MGRTEETDGCAENVFQGGIAAGQLFMDAAAGVDCEPGMGDGVVADEMSSGLDLSDEIGPLANVAADEEERSADILLRQQVEQAAGPGIVGAVVVGEGELGRVATGDEGASKELRLRIHRRVGAASGSKSSSRANRSQSDEHLETV